MDDLDASVEFAVSAEQETLPEDVKWVEVDVIIIPSDSLFESSPDIPAPPDSKPAVRATRSVPMEDVHVDPAPSPSTTAVVPSTDPNAHVAAVGLPDTAQLAQALPKMQNDSATVAMAAIAVLGGGAAWKFYSQKNKLAHEERLEKMKLDHQRQETDHGACKLVQASLQGKIAELETKLAHVEQKSLSLSKGFDPEEIEDRLEALEKKAGARRRKTTGET